jgi:hypothetical protein
MKKIEPTKEQVEEMLHLYNVELLGSPTIAEKMGLSKPTVIRILKENGAKFGPSGRKFKGGKSVSDKKYRTKKEVVDRIKSYFKNWSKENKEHLNEYCKNWTEKNIERVRAKKAQYEREKKAKDPKYKISSVFRTALYTALKEKDILKDKKCFELLGYTKNDLIKHLTKLLEPGMTLENYGEWHIDHIIPISKFNYTSTQDDEFKECWSLSNLKPMWGPENISKSDKIIAHQYKIRQQKEIEQQNAIDFNITKVSLKNCEIRQITRKECEPIINEYEWLGYLPRYTNYYFGIFFKIDDREILGGVVAYQPEYGENMGVWDKYGYTGKIIQLSRGVCLWWTPKNTASFFITRTNEWLKKNTHYKVVTATVDSSAGEIGTIYQSMNWYYVGTFGGNITKTGKERIRYGYIINGKTYNQRHIRSMIGTAKKENVLKHFPDVKMVNLGRKKRYFTFLGNKKENEELFKPIKNLIKEYPKR